MSYHLIDVMERLGRPRVLVLGDLILDRYVWGEAERISQEAPVILLREDKQESRLGGAANVANMLRGLEVDVTLAGVVGDDHDGEQVLEHLQHEGVDCGPLVVDNSRPTTVKIRFMGRAQHRHPHQMLRVDRETRKPVSQKIADALLARLLPRLDDFQAILISDYAKGVGTAEVLRPLITAARARGLPVVVDPAAGGDYRLYEGVTGVTPNRSETAKATGRSVQTIADAGICGQQLVRDYRLEMAFVTLDRDGILLAKKSGENLHLPTRVREVYDVTGAGDMVLAMFGVGMAAGVDPVDLTKLANVAGGLEVEQVGVVPISRRQILADLLQTARQEVDSGKVCSLESLARHLSARRKTGQRIVLTNGCFDLLHAGHVSYLREAAREGDCLVVAINSDASVRRLGKGDDRPLFDQEYRANMLAALEVVDHVVIFDEDTPHAVLRALQPDVLVKGGTYRDDEIVGREVVLGYGGQVKALGAVPGLSTTEIVRRLRASEARTMSLPSVGQIANSDDNYTERKAA